jgi:hypothetical protein
VYKYKRDMLPAYNDCRKADTIEIIYTSKDHQSFYEDQ